jgi:hypothetical protein
MDSGGGAGGDTDSGSGAEGGLKGNEAKRRGYDPEK